MGSKSYTVWRMCKSKRVYETIEAAMSILNLHIGKDQKLHIYLCPFCFSYHIGHYKKGEAKNG